MGSVGPHTPAGEAAARVLADRAAPLFDLGRRAASGRDADAVHDMRVASRRLRAALAVFEGVYPKREGRVWRRFARRVTRALGRVRDADVFLAELTLLADHAEGAEERVALAYIVGHMQGERARELAAMRRTLLKADPASRKAAFARFANAPRGSGATLWPLARLATAVIDERLAEVGRLSGRALKEDASAAQHRLRIALKRLRYAIETLRPALSDGADDVLVSLKRLQDALGELHDRDVFIEAVEAMSADAGATTAGVSPAGIAAVTARLRRERAALFARFAAEWGTSGGPALKRAVAGLLPEPRA